MQKKQHFPKPPRKRALGHLRIFVFFTVLLYPQNRHWEVLKAWWTLHVTHADLAGYWQSLTGIPVVAPGATLAVASVIQRTVQAYLVAP